MEVKCNECAKTFEIDLKEKDLDKGYKFRYFDCPHCSYRYEVLKYKPESIKKWRR